MADSFIRVPTDSTGKRVDATSLDVGADTVYRQRIVIGSDNGTATFAEVLSASAAATSHGLVVRPTTATVVVASGTINVNGGVAISGTAQVAIATPFTLNNISATVNTSSVIRTSGGTAVEDTTNNALRVNVVAGAAGGVSHTDGTPFTAQQAAFVPMGGVFDDVSPDTLSEGDAGVARVTTNRAIHVNLRDTGGTGLGTAGNALAVNVHAISATASVVLAAGAANIGTVNDISRTVQVAIATPFTVNNISATVVVAGSVSLASTATVVNATASPLMVAVLDSTDATRVNVGDSANSALRVNIVAGAAAGGTSRVDGTTFSTQAADFTPIGGIFDDTAPDTLSENDAGVVRMTTNRAFHVNLRDTGGTGLGTAGNALAVNVHAISATASVVLAAGAANIGVVNNISATVTVAGNISAAITNAINISNTPSVILAAGTANFGTLNHISRTVQVAVGTPFTINNISATVGVTGTVALAAGAANIGTINDISRTVQVQVGTPFTVNNISASTVIVGAAAHDAAASGNPVMIAGFAADSAPAAVASGDVARAFMDTQGRFVTIAGSPARLPSASHGPRTIIASTSSNVTLIAAPGAALSIHVTHLMVTNASASSIRARVGPSSSIQTIAAFMASGGGGFVLKFDPPWKVSANEALLCSVDPNASEGIFNVHYYIAA